MSIIARSLRLASLDPEIRPLLIPVVAREFDTKEQLDKYLKDHPKADKAKHTVKKDKGESGGSDDDKGSGGVKSWLDKVKGLAARGKKTLEELPAKVQKTLTDPKERKEAMTAAGKALKEAPKKMATELKDHFVHEIKATSSGIGKILNGEKPDKKEAEAMFSLAVEVAAAATVVSTGGTIGAAGFFGKSMAKHIALSAVNPMLGRLHILQEMGHLGHVLGHMGHAAEVAIHHAAEEKDPKDLTDDEKANVFVNTILTLVADQLEKGMTDEELVKALNGDHPELDLDKLSFGKGKKAHTEDSISVQYSRGSETTSPRGAAMNTSEAALRTNLIRLAKSYPKGSDERRKVLKVITGADFDPSGIAEVKPGALEEGTPEEAYQGDQFTQQEFSELGDKQEKGELGMKVDDTEKSMPTGQQDEGRLAALQERALFDELVKLAKADKEARGPVLNMLREAGYITPEGKVASEKFAGCEKLPEGPMRDNCEKKDDKKAAEKWIPQDLEEGRCTPAPNPDCPVGSPQYNLAQTFKKHPEWGEEGGKHAAEDMRVRAGLIRLANKHPEFKNKVLPLVVAFDKENGIDHAALRKAHTIQAATKGAKTAIDAAKAAMKKALELGYDKAAAVAEGKKAHAAFTA